MTNLTKDAEPVLDDTAIEQNLGRDGEPGDIGSSLFTPRTIVSFLLGLVIIYFVIRRTNLDLADALRQIRRANPVYLVVALAAYYFTFVIRGWRWSVMLASAGISEATGHRMPGTVGMFQIFTLSWFVNSLLPARMGDAYRCYLIKRRANASFGISLGTMLAERLIDLVVLVFVLMLAGVTVYGTHAPDRAENAFLVGGAVVVIGVVGVAVLWLLRDRVEQFLPSRLARVYSRVRTGLFESLGRPRVPILISVGIWLCDGLRVFLVAWSLGQHISYQAAIMVALLSALVSTVPITPAGLGFVEGIMIYALTTIGVSSSTAGAIALLDRVVTYGSLIIVGGIMYLWVLRKDLRVTDADSG